jgi:hypothetical protein
MRSTHTAELDLPIPTAARIGHIVPALACRALLSPSQFLDNGCKISPLTPTTAKVAYAGTTILTCNRTPETRLWEVNHLPCPPPALPLASLPAAEASYNAVIHSDASTANLLVAFTHAALFSLAISTLERALCLNFLPEMAGLTLKSLQRHPPGIPQP